MAQWENIGKVRSRLLRSVRVQFHQAVQILKAVGTSFLRHQPDDSHQSMEWLNEINAMGSQLFGDDNDLRVAITFRDFKLLILNSKNEVLESLDLDDVKRDDAIEWVKVHLENRGMNTEIFTVDEDFVAAPREPFNAEEDKTQKEFEKYYNNAAMLIKPIAERKSNASPLRCWPHHFDLATLITLDAEAGKTIGVGLSPGDGYYDEPYFYVTPWPYPDTGEVSLPQLPGGGKWHTHEWVGAVLTASDLYTGNPAELQEQSTKLFLNEAIRILEDILS